MTWISRSLLALAAGAMLPSLALAAGDRDEGLRLAERYCQGCHVIGAANRLGGIGSTPSFFLMAENFENYRQRLWSLKLRRPHKALDRLTPLEPADIEHILAYISELERP